MGIFCYLCGCGAVPAQEAANTPVQDLSAKNKYNYYTDPNDSAPSKVDQNADTAEVSTPAPAPPGAKMKELSNSIITNAGKAEKEPPAEPTEYIGSCFPTNEAQRWDYLCSLNVLDTEPEQRFDDLTKLCCMVFKVPIALVSLVDKERQWFKSAQGVPVAVTETDRKSSFCAWTLLPRTPTVLVVENALDDARFIHNPLVVGFPHIRFYAGCPLVSSAGYRLGSLCIIDTRPRQFDTAACNMLVNMTEMVVRELEKEKMLEQQRQRSELLTKENTQLLRAIDCFSEGIMLCNLSSPNWSVLFVNEAWEQLTGISREEAFSQLGFWDRFKVEGFDSDIITKQYSEAIQRGESFDLQVHFTAKDGQRMFLDLQFRCAGNTQMENGPLIGVPSILTLPPGEGSSTYYFAVCGEQPRSDAQEVKDVAGPLHLIPMRKPFDDVRLGPLLGKGAFGRVYRGTWNGAHVAVKVIEHYSSEQEGSQPPSLLEAGLHNQVCHPNVVQTYKHDTRTVSTSLDAGRKLLETWMVLEFCNKGSVSDAAERGWFHHGANLAECNLAYVLATAMEVAGAMCYLHAKGILHGDLTGNNILLSSSDKDERGFTTKVADFGLSRMLALGADSVNTRTYGTVTHMPPELLLTGRLSKGADVYSFGVLLWEMYCGKRPYQGLSHGQVIHHITSGRTLEFPEGAPERFVEVAYRCFAAEADSRPSFPELMQMMEDMAVEDL